MLRGHRISDSSAASLLKETDYSLQSNKKCREGVGDHPDRDARFRHIARKTKIFQSQNQPVISVDTKKKENVGNYNTNSLSK